MIIRPGTQYTHTDPIPSVSQDFSTHFPSKSVRGSVSVGQRFGRPSSWQYFGACKACKGFVACGVYKWIGGRWLQGMYSFGYSMRVECAYAHNINAHIQICSHVSLSFTHLGDGLKELLRQIRQARARVDKRRGVHGDRQRGVPDGGGLDPHGVGVVAALHRRVFHGAGPQPVVGAAEDDEGAVLHVLSNEVESRGIETINYKSRQQPERARTSFPQKVTILGRPFSAAMVSRNEG